MFNLLHYYDEGAVAHGRWYCFACRAAIPADWNQTCRQLFFKLSELELKRKRTYGVVHRLTEACWALQHPGKQSPRHCGA